MYLKYKKQMSILSANYIFLYFTLLQYKYWWIHAQVAVSGASFESLDTLTHFLLQVTADFFRIKPDSDHLLTKCWECLNLTIKKSNNTVVTTNIVLEDILVENKWNTLDRYVHLNRKRNHVSLKTYLLLQIS